MYKNGWHYDFVLQRKRLNLKKMELFTKREWGVLIQTFVINHASFAWIFRIVNVTCLWRKAVQLYTRFVYSLSCLSMLSYPCACLGNPVGSSRWPNSRRRQKYCSDVSKRFKPLYQTLSRRLAAVKRWRCCGPWRPAWGHSVHTAAACFAISQRLSFTCDYVTTGHVNELIAIDLVFNARYVTAECHVLSGIIS